MCGRLHGMDQGKCNAAQGLGATVCSCLLAIHSKVLRGVLKIGPDAARDAREQRFCRSDNVLQLDFTER